MQRGAVTGNGSPRQAVVRSASEHDAAACAAIYAPYVTDTAITFETVAPSQSEMAKRIATASRDHAWLVLEDDGRVVGYAYGGPVSPAPGVSLGV